MNAELFVAEIKNYAPSRESLEKFGLSEKFISKQLSKYNCHPRSKPLTEVLLNSEVLRLINEYDCSELTIGILSFANEITENENHFFIGNVEADILAINKVTHEIQVLDYTNLNWVINGCASNGATLLDALFQCIVFFSKSVDLDDAEKNKLTYEYVLFSSEKAGGEKYVDFYKLLLGYFQ